MAIEEKEQLIRVVSQIGNGAHIFAPKEWINEKVLIVRLEKKSVKEQILERIYPHLDKVIAVFLYGSHARNEATESSDIDVFIVAKEKFSIEKKEKQDFIVVAEKDMEASMKTNPILLYSIFKESKPIINPSYLENLQNIKINKNYFKDFIDSTRSSIKSTKEIIQLDKKTGKYSSDSVIYSEVLRLRGVFIIECLLSNNDFTNKKFKKWLAPLKIDFEKIYDIYGLVRNNKSAITNIPIEQEEKMINFLEEKLNLLEKKLK